MSVPSIEQMSVSWDLAAVVSQLNEISDDFLLHHTSHI